ncbi:MAG TPA: IS1634 family transposase [Candidatus Onthocola stercoravium]|nr:IS1634 family transposase [Candidatus Onthocola stercoravium]
MRLKTVSTKSNNNYAIIADYKKLNGKKSTYVYENLGNDQNLKERFGTENTMDKVKEYINSLNQMIKDGKELPVNLTLNPNKQIEKNINRCFYSGHFFLRKIYYDLGIDKICKNIKDKYKFTFDINAVVECLLYARIIWPSSKLSTFEQSRKFIGNYDFDLQHVYRTLTYLSHEINTIQKELFDNSSKVIDRNYKVIYYDCTNYFFYTEENDFQRYGISKQHQPNPLVQMGLFMDADGYPFAMNINPGNTSETKTMIPTEEEFLKNYNMAGSNIIVCTDAAMCTDEIKKFNVKDGRGFVITQSIKKLNNKLQEFALDRKGWRILGNLMNVYNLDEIEKDEQLKKKYFNTIFYKEIECETASVMQTLIVTFSFKYQVYQYNLKLHQLERARKLVEETNKKNKKIAKKKDVEKIKISKNPNDPKRFIKEIKTTDAGEIACNIEYIIDEEIYKNEEKYNGLYGITTNLIDDTATIIKVMNGRWEIEESFRIMKDDFDSGTVHLSREDRIKGHFITCFLALFIYRYLEHQLDDKYTVNEIISKLQEMKLLEHNGKGFEPIQTRDDLTDALHDFLGINTDTEIITYKKIKEILDMK